VKRDLASCSKSAMNAGIARESIVLDAGFGFGKTFDENYPLLARFGELHELGFPLLAGTSRKSFIRHTLDLDGEATASVKQDRLYGSLASITAAVLQGAHIVRVHDVRAAVDAVKIADKILAAETAKK
jgi:dihydropteroate synthase